MARRHHGPAGPRRMEQLGLPQKVFRRRGRQRPCTTACRHLSCSVRAWTPGPLGWPLQQASPHLRSTCRSTSRTNVAESGCPTTSTKYLWTLNTRIWARHSRQDGYRADATTIFVWEGVTQYLTRPAVHAIFEVLAKAPAGSRLAFSYVCKVLSSTAPTSTAHNRPTTDSLPTTPSGASGCTLTTSATCSPNTAGANENRSVLTKTRPAIDPGRTCYGGHRPGTLCVSRQRAQLDGIRFTPPAIAEMVREVY